jgi:hypothetical protein
VDIGSGANGSQDLLHHHNQVRSQKMQNSPSTTTEGTSLFGKTMMVLTGMMATGAAGAYIGAGLGGGWLLGLAIAWLIMTILTVLSLSAAKANPSFLPAGVGVAALWTFMSGLVTGPAIAQYAVELGQNTVFGAFLGTSAVMAICGGIGMLSGVNFSRLSGILGIALWGLIIVSLVGCFVAFSSTFNIVYCLVGLAVFTGYFLVDFWRVRSLGEAGENDWATAILLSMALYLDFLNFFLYLLRLLSELKKKD